MRAVVFAEPGLVQVRDVVEPVVREGNVLLRVTQAGICGIDLKMWNGRMEGAQVGRVLGHEVVGRAPDGRRVVLDPLMNCGTCAACVRGDTNLCMHLRVPGLDGTPGWFAERVAVHTSQLLPIPDSLTDERAVMAEPLANVAHLFQLVPPKGCGRIAIVGFGQMGAMALQVALRSGARDVVALDICPARVAIAREMGATRAVPVAEEAGRAEALRCAASGLDLVIDAAGTKDARQLAFALCSPGGLVVLLGMGERMSAIDFSAVIRRELRVQTSFGYRRRDLVEAVDALASGVVDLSAQSRSFAMADAQEGFETANAKGKCLKALLNFAA